MGLSFGTAKAKRRSVAGLGFVLTLIMGIGPLLTTGFSAMGPLITLDLGLSRLEFGSFAVVACVTAALLSAPLGVMTDRHSQFIGVLLLHCFGLCAVVAAATAQNIFGLWVSALLGGVALGLANPLTNGMVANRVDPMRRGMLVGVKQTGVQLAQILTSLLCPLAAALFSWRAGFLVGGLITMGSLWIALYYLHARPQHFASHFATSVRPKDSAVRGIVWFMLFAFFYGILYQALSFYLPLFAFEHLGLHPGLAAMCGLVLGVTGLISRVLWGKYSEHFEKPSTPLALIAVFSALAVALLTCASLWANTMLLWVGTALYGLSGTATSVILLTTVMRLVPKAQTGSVTGMIFIGIFSGFAAGPVLFGLLVDHWGYSTGWLGLMACSILMLLAPLGLRRSIPHLRHHSANVVCDGRDQRSIGYD